MTAGLTTAPPRTIPIALSIWFLAALLLGPWVFAALPFPGPELTIIALAVLAVIGVRPWFETLPWRALVGMHALRLVGVAFLILSANGVFATTLADRAGWGDIIAALGAIGLAFLGPRPKWLAYAWNAFGLLDVFVAVGTVTLVHGSGTIPGVEPLTHLPLSLVPMFIVPLLIASHIAIFRRLRGA